MELLEGGELLEVLAASSEKLLTEGRARDIVHQVLQGLGCVSKWAVLPFAPWKRVATVLCLVALTFLVPSLVPFVSPDSALHARSIVHRDLKVGGFVAGVPSDDGLTFVVLSWHVSAQQHRIFHRWHSKGANGVPS